MRITTTQPLFAWECLDDSPSLRTIREFLGTVPDAKLLNALHRWRGRGRDDYPVNEVLPALVEQGRGNLPPGRIKTLAYDKAADDTKVHRFLHQANISPLIENRRMWKDQTEQMLPGHDGNSNIVYDEAGTVYCYDKVSDPAVRHKMSYIGHEPQRGTLKYRCPAKHQGWSCPSNKRCNAGKTYGLTVRVKREIDLRRFPPIPRATKQFERRYKGRTTVERVNARIKIFWGADDGNITGARRFHAYLGVVLVVHAGLATLLATDERRDARPNATLGGRPGVTQEAHRLSHSPRADHVGKPPNALPELRPAPAKDAPCGPHALGMLLSANHLPPQ